MSFYMALPSHANRREFPQNQANSFKIRLRHPLHLPGGQWQVGLSVISLPDTRVNMYDLVKKGELVLKIRWVQAIPPSVSQDSIDEAETNIDDLKKLDWIVDGVSFMKAAINHAEQQRRAKAVLGGKFVNTSGQHTYVKFRWEGEDLLIDNTHVCHCRPSSTPSVALPTKLALKMGWVVLSSTHLSGFVLGPNFVNTSGQHTYVKFRWEGEDLLIDNTHVCHFRPSSTPSVALHTKLALKMGWVVLSSTHLSGFVLGPNLQQEFLGDQVPTMAPGVDGTI